MWFFHLLVLIGILRIYNAKILNQCVQHVLYHLLSSDTNQIMQVEQTVYSRPLNTMQTTIRLFFLSEGARDQICTDRRKPRRPVSFTSSRVTSLLEILPFSPSSIRGEKTPAI